MNVENIKNKMMQVILEFSIPAVIAMVLTSLITIADGFFVGNYVGKEGLAAINLGLPILYLYLAVGIMVGVGGSAIAGMALGAGELKKCRGVFTQTMAVSGMASLLLSVVVAIMFAPIQTILIKDPQVAAYFHNYYLLMLLGFPIMVLNSSFGMFIRGEGNPQFYMKVNILGVVLNILLDYLFIAKLGCEVMGVAFASLISMTVTLVLIVDYFIRKSSVFKFTRFRFSKSIFKKTILNGSSEFIGEMSMSISMFAYNWVILRKVGVAGIAAFTVVGYISFIFSMIITGVGQGVSPLISFTYGAKEQLLSQKIRRKAEKIVFFTGAAVVIGMLLCSGWYSSLFVKDVQVTAMVQSGIWIFVFSFLFSGINTIASFYFTSIGKAKESAVISSLRGLVLLLIGIFTLPALLGMTGVWLVAPITEGITFGVAVYYLKKEA